MNHWFDDLTKGLARGKLSRRAMLGSALKAGVAAAGAALLGRSSVAQLVLANSEVQRDEGPCKIHQEGRVRTLNLATRSTFKGRPITLEHNVRRIIPRQETRSSKVFKLGGSVLLQVDVFHAKGPIQITVNYGEAFQGVRRATFRSTDGKVLEGDIDGRRIRPFRVGDDSSSVKFADGGPPPTMKFDPDLPDAIKSLLEQAKRSAGSCSAGQTKNAHAVATAVPISPQGESGHNSSPQTSSGCIGCELGCTIASYVCGGACGGGCAAALLGYPICLGICLGGCAAVFAGCFDHCHTSGEACCPVTCGDDACCETSETCLSLKQGICCSKGLVACAAKHCCKQSDTCIHATGFCCPKGHNRCNDVCCDKGEVCKDGVTCCPPNNVVCKGVCCKEGQVCKGGVCCQPSHVACNGVCCKKDEVCVNDKKCCSKGQACGKVCCEENFRCVDKNKGICCVFAVKDCNGICCKIGETCVNGKCCPKPCGDACCGSGEACQNGTCVSLNCSGGKVTCISQDAPGKYGAALCCPQNAGCCLGKCCKPGESCCSGPGKPFGCHPVGSCVA